MIADRRHRKKIEFDIIFCDRRKIVNEYKKKNKPDNKTLGFT